MNASYWLTTPGAPLEGLRHGTLRDGGLEVDAAAVDDLGVRGPTSVEAVLVRERHEAKPAAAARRAVYHYLSSRPEAK